MKPKQEPIKKHMRKYNVMIISLIALSLIMITAVWVWYDHKSQQLEKQIFMLK